MRTIDQSREMRTYKYMYVYVRTEMNTAWGREKTVILVAEFWGECRSLHFDCCDSDFSAEYLLCPGVPCSMDQQHSIRPVTASLEEWYRGVHVTGWPKQRIFFGRHIFFRPKRLKFHFSVLFYFFINYWSILVNFAYTYKYFCGLHFIYLLLLTSLFGFGISAE